MGRDGGRGGGGGGVGLTDDGVAGRTGEEDPAEKRLETIQTKAMKQDVCILSLTASSPLLVPPAPGTAGAGDDTVVRYVGGGGGGGGDGLRMLCLVPLGEVTSSPPLSLGWLVSLTLDCPS